MTALQVFVQPLQHAAGLLAGAARSLERDMIAALLRYYAEPTFDQREILSVLAEQHGGQLVVLEREHDLRGRRLLGGGSGWDHGIRCAQGASQAPAVARAGISVFCPTSAPNNVLVPISVTATGTSEPINSGRAMTC